MIHTNRTFALHQVNTLAELIENLTKHTWTRCTAFQLDALFFLNDSFSEDGAQEYAVVRDGRQIESVTVSWLSRGEAYGIFRLLVDGGGVDLGPCNPTIEDQTDHICPLCR